MIEIQIALIAVGSLVAGFVVEDKFYPYHRVETRVVNLYFRVKDYLASDKKFRF